jgi:hypothetical protein
LAHGVEVLRLEAALVVVRDERLKPHATKQRIHFETTTAEFDRFVSNLEDPTKM